MQGMAHSFLIFDFGNNEESAQQARHRIEGWKQGFRLDKKLQVKFERKERRKIRQRGNSRTGKGCEIRRKGESQARPQNQNPKSIRELTTRRTMPRKFV